MTAGITSYSEVQRENIMCARGFTEPVQRPATVGEGGVVLQPTVTVGGAAIDASALQLVADSVHRYPTTYLRYGN